MHTSVWWSMSAQDAGLDVAQLLHGLLSVSIGGAIAFPGAVMWHMEWRGSPGDNFPVELIVMVLLGGAGGGIWAATRSQRRKRLLRAVAVLLALSPYVGLVVYASYALVRDRPAL